VKGASCSGLRLVMFARLDQPYIKVLCSSYPVPLHLSIHAGLFCCAPIRGTKASIETPIESEAVKVRAHLEEVKACRVETRENTRAKAKVILRRVTGSI
jgi:hypothetical protein